MDQTPLDPHNTMLVVSNKAGERVGEIAATAPNAQDYLMALVRAHGSIDVEYVDDAPAAQASRLASSLVARISGH